MGQQLYFDLNDFFRYCQSKILFIVGTMIEESIKYFIIMLPWNKCLYQIRCTLKYCDKIYVMHTVAFYYK